MNDALVADIVVGVEDGTELAQAVAVDAARNLIYVTRCGLFTGGCEPGRNALVVLRGAEFDPATRALLRVPEVIAEISPIGLTFGGGRRAMALDPQRNLIYVAGAFGSIGAGAGFGSTDVTVLDGLQIVDAQGQVTPNPAAAILGIIPIKVLDDLIPIVADYSSPEIAFNAEEGLLYVVTRSTAPFTEGFLAVINSALVLDANRNFVMTPHPDEPTTLISLIATIPAGLEPEFVAIDTTRNRVIVSNQSPGALLVLQGLSVR